MTDVWEAAGTYRKGCGERLIFCAYVREGGWSHLRRSVTNSGALIKGPRSETEQRPVIKRHSAERWVTPGVSVCG